MILVAIGLASAGAHVVVKAGDTLAEIAQRWGISEGELRSSNQLTGEPPPGTILDLPGEAGEAVLTNAVGDVRVRHPRAAEVAGVPGDELPVGSVVCTGTDGFATLRLASGAGGDHDEVSLLPGTCLTITSASRRGERRTSQVDIATGSVTVRDASDDRGDVIIHTESGVTAGSGGGFRVSVEPGAARTEAISDPVAVIGAGVQVDVGAGEGARTRTGAAPGPVVKLLAQPSLLGPAPGSTLTAAVFTWEPVPAGLGYRFTVATDPEQTFVVHNNAVETVRWRPALFELPAETGAWWWSVAAIDADGFVGVPATARCFKAPPGVARTPGACP